MPYCVPLSFSLERVVGWFILEVKVQAAVFRCFLMMLANAFFCGLVLLNSLSYEDISYTRWLMSFDMFLSISWGGWSLQLASYVEGVVVGFHLGPKSRTI